MPYLSRMGTKQLSDDLPENVSGTTPTQTHAARVPSATRGSDPARASDRGSLQFERRRGNDRAVLVQLALGKSLAADVADDLEELQALVSSAGADV
ncbi:MAG: hypothetical protein ACRDAM_07770, partial [Casimicrobium sp.]